MVYMYSIEYKGKFLRGLYGELNTSTPSNSPNTPNTLTNLNELNSSKVSGYPLSMY